MPEPKDQDFTRQGPGTEAWLEQGGGCKRVGGRPESLGSLVAQCCKVCPWVRLDSTGTESPNGFKQGTDTIRAVFALTTMGKACLINGEDEERTRQVMSSNSTTS